MPRSGVEGCHKDDIRINYWQPLPPSIYDADGVRLYGYEECGLLGTDMQSCTNPDCTDFEVRRSGQVLVRSLTLPGAEEMEKGEQH